MTVNLVRVKSGSVAEFLDRWRMIVAAHKKAAIDEHWAVYEVESGMPDTTFLFLYPRKSLAGASMPRVPSHRATGFRTPWRQRAQADDRCGAGRHRDERDPPLQAPSRNERLVEGVGGG